MVFKQSLRHWAWAQVVMLRGKAFVLLLSVGVGLLFSQEPLAENFNADQLLSDAGEFYRSGHYFKAARYAFAAQEADPKLEGVAYSWMTLGLLQSGLHQSASYFFIRTLQTGDKGSIRRVLPFTQSLLMRVGADLLRKYLIRHTQYEDYDPFNRSAYLYVLAREAILQGDTEKVIGYVNGMNTNSPLLPFGIQLRASAYALQGKNEESIKDYETCEREASRYPGHLEAEDLKARCQVGIARVLYQMNRFVEAERAYEQVSKQSLVWPEILFERAWNAFAREEYNRTLGRLVTYKSPALQFVFNTETDVLRAQAYLALCLYADANEVINEFHGHYQAIGEAVKKFVEKNSSNLPLFYETGKQALADRLDSKVGMNPMLNRFVRSPYFKNLVAVERALQEESHAIRRFDVLQGGVSHRQGAGFPGFLDLVLQWRNKSIKLLGGAFVKNSLLDYHAALISDFEKIAFIKLEMLSRAKHRLVYKKSAEGERSRGNHIPFRRDDQYYWSFNGEFWGDELGDYIFGLESDCGNSS